MDKEQKAQIIAMILSLREAGFNTKDAMRAKYIELLTEGMNDAIAEFDKVLELFS